MNPTCWVCRQLLENEALLKAEFAAASATLSLDHVLLTGATCLLQKSQRNCSVIIFGVEEVLNTVVQVAKAAKEVTASTSTLEEDHADYVVAIQSSLLRNGPSERGFNRKAKLKRVRLHSSNTFVLPGFLGSCGPRGAIGRKVFAIRLPYHRVL